MTIDLTTRQQIIAKLLDEQQRRQQKLREPDDDGFWDALQEPEFGCDDDLDDGFRINPSEVPIATKGIVRPEQPWWIEPVLWLLVLACVGFWVGVVWLCGRAG